ncbi:MAG: discoidin domain-containing protein, partial [bacterium]
MAMQPIPAFPAHETSSHESCHACHGSSYANSTSENVHHPSPGSCNGCHADQGIMAFEDGGKKSDYTGPHAYHTDIDASSEKMRKYAFSCEVCHAKLNLGTETTHGNKRASALDPNASTAQYAEVYFHDDTIEWKSLPIHQRSYRYRSLFHNPYENNSSVTPGYVSKDYTGTALEDPIDPNITWSNQSISIRNSCSNIWCHSNANPLKPHDANPGDGTYRENSYQAQASFPLTWDDHDGDRCNNCHGFTDSIQESEMKYYLSSLHRRHIGTPAREKIACGQCHSLTCESASNILFRDDQRDKDGYFYHVNGQKDIAFQTEINPGGVYDHTNHTCSSLYCHPQNVSWDTAGSEHCASCHPVYADDQGHDTIATGGHYVHLAADWGPHIVCSDCHASPSYAEGQVGDRSSANTVVSKDDPGWEPDMWKGYMVFFRELPSSSGARTIKSNTRDTLFLEELEDLENLENLPAGAFSIICPGNLTHCDGKVNFNDGLTLATTAVCDTCHSPDGDYDGVNNEAIGATKNWQTGVYTETGTYMRLSEGKERWCVGCHDKKPSNSRPDGSGVTAPNIAGDEQVFTLYGKGYGYFKTGHGLSAGENYPASQDSGAGAACTDCHDVHQPHIDHAHRSYSAEKNNYRVGYRLQKAEEIEPMDIPRTWYDGLPNNNLNNNPQKDWQDFALCFTCHDRYKLLGDGGSDDKYYQDPLQTNFFNNTYRKCLSEDDCYPLNLHTTHLAGRFNGKNLDWTSSWGNTADSSLSCPACHNVHGSLSPRMMRHGELISTPNTYDKVPGLHFTYFVNFENYPGPPKDIILVDSAGGEMFSQYKSGPGNVTVNKICNTCHQGWCWYFRTPQVDPKILSARAMNSPHGAQGIDDGDQLIITFSVPTNGQNIITGPERIPDIFKVYEDANQNEAMLRSWGIIKNIEWSDAGGHTDDTLAITLTKDPPPTIAPGHLLVIRSGELKDLQTNEPITSSKPITGTFDCSLARAYAQDKSGESGIQAGDQVTVEFLGSTAGNFWPEYCITAKNIDQSLLLNKSHSWGQLLGDPSWSSNHGDNDTLTIIMGSGASLAPGDTITLGDTIRDEHGNPIIGSAILEGSFDPPLWSRPPAIYDFSGQGPPGSEAIKSIDGDRQTYWHPAGPGGWIVYDLAAEHQVRQVRIFCHDIFDAEGNKISGIKVSVTIWVSSNSLINDPSFADSPVIAKWEVINESGWHYSPLFEPPQNGRYIKIEASKRGGPLIHFFCEVEFKGIAPPAPPS